MLTSLRALAALEVVFLHALSELGGESVRALPLIVREGLTRGGLAVSFFFVLSGFILTYTYSDADGGLTGTPRKFWRARFARIYPIYFLGFAMDAPRVISFFIGSAASLASAVAKIGIASLAYLTLLQSWHPRVTNSWNTPGWSLSTEAFFYAVFPALVAVTKPWRFRRFLGVALGLWALPIIAYTILFYSHTVELGSAAVQTFWRSFPPLRLSEFVLGVAAGRLFLSGGLTPHLKWLRWAGVVACALILALPVFAFVLPETVVDNTLDAPLFAVAILAAASGAIPTPRWLSAPPLVLLGRASYAVYIIHVPFKPIFSKCARLVGLESPSPALLISYLLSLELLCIALFLWFEDPLRRLITRSSAR
ncbi:MAG TPA: acyltransferase [Polyangiaceae bacterium]|nr:acyltransferase [Polyangiaceae bacterium]